MTDPTRLLEQHLAACDANPLAVIHSQYIDEALRHSNSRELSLIALRLCLLHPGPIPDARIVMEYAATVATEQELIALASKLYHAHYPYDPDVFFHAPNAARLLSRISLDVLIDSLPDVSSANLAMALGLAVVISARREGREVPDQVLPLLRTGLQQINRLDETIIVELLDGPWSRVWPDVAERPWLFCVGESNLPFEKLGAFETVALAIASDLGDVLLNRWLAATEESDRIRFAAALAWGFPVARAGEVLATLVSRSWRERQSLLSALVRHGDELLSAIDVALLDPRSQKIALRVWLELPPTEAVLSRWDQMAQIDPEETEVRKKTERTAETRTAKFERTLDARELAWQMVLRYLRAGRRFTESVLAPAIATLQAGDRRGVLAAWLLFESVTVTAACDPLPSVLQECWRPFVHQSATDLSGVFPLCRALLSLPDREAIECEGASAISWVGDIVDVVLKWLIHRDPPPWAET